MSLLLWPLMTSCGDNDQVGVGADVCTDCADIGADEGQGDPCPCGLGQICGVSTSAESLCVPGCDDTSPCASGYQCSAGVCVDGCSADTHCAAGERCVAGDCLLSCSLSAQCAMGRACIDELCVDVDCLSDADCGRGERCSERVCEALIGVTCERNEGCGRNGVCADGFCVECASDDDCRSGRVCNADNRCEQGTQPEVSFVPVASGVERHAIVFDEADFTGYGPGYAIVDVNRDGRLDIAAGRTPQTSMGGLCVYANVSAAGEILFEPLDRLCDINVPAMAVSTTDFDGDGWEEIVAMGVRSVVWIDPSDPDSQRDLLEELPADDPRRGCSAGSALSIDFNADGYLDLLIGCQIPPDQDFPEDIFIEELTYTRNVLLYGSADGPRWAPPSDAAGAYLDDPGVTLAFAALMDQTDGRWTIVHANDSFSLPSRRNLDFAPGTYLAPEPPDVWDIATNFAGFVQRPILADESSWGSFMGTAELRVGEETYLLLSDAGPLRALRRLPTGFVDEADALGLALPEQDGFLLYSWAMTVDDYDADGLDDVLIVHGMVADRDIDAHLSHRDVLALQNADGTFDAFYEGFGVTLPSERPVSAAGLPPQGRAAMKLDADGDGRLELLLTYNLGSPEYYELDEEPRRCTVLPRPATVVSRDAGFAFELGDSVWRTWDVGGQHRASPARDLIVPGRSGRLRFPSGYIADFECGPDGRTEVIEPQWMYRVDEPRPVIHIERPVFDGVEISTIDGRWRNGAQSGVTRLAKRAGTDDWIALDAPDNAEIMVRINGRWLWRWW